MKTQKNHKPTKRWAALILATLALQGCGGAPGSKNQLGSGGSIDTNNSPEVGGEGEEIFTDVGADVLNTIQSDDEEPTLRKRFVKVNLASLRKTLANAPVPSRMKLKLFDDRVVEIGIESVDKVSADNIVVVGRISGDEDSAVTLVINKEVAVANIRRGEVTESFELKYMGNGVHVIRVPNGEPAEDCKTVDVSEAERAGDAPMVSAPQGGATASVLASPVVRVLAAYTPLARSRQGGTSAIKALIQMGVADTNRALSDSGSTLRVELAGTLEVSKNETGDLDYDLSKLRGKGDGRWDEVHSARSRVNADQVTLVGSYAAYPTTAGIGYVNASYSSAFTIVKSSYFKMYTFSHELGHNLGLNHSDGYLSSAGRFRTIIAYGSYPRIRRYSNPNRTYNGYRTGTSYKNETAIINRNAYNKASLAP